MNKSLILYRYYLRLLIFLSKYLQWLTILQSSITQYDKVGYLMLGLKTWFSNLQFSNFLFKHEHNTVLFKFCITPNRIFLNIFLLTGFVIYLYFVYFFHFKYVLYYSVLCILIKYYYHIFCDIVLLKVIKIYSKFNII